MSYNQFAQDTQQQQPDENQPISQVENLASLDVLLQQSDTTQGQQQQTAGAEGEDLVERAILMQEQQDAEAEEIDRLNRFDVDAAFDEDDNENHHGRSTNSNNQQHVGQDGEHVIAPTHRSNGIIVDFGRNDQMNDEIDVDEDDDADHDDEDDTNNEVEIVDADDAAVSSPKSKRGKKAKSSNADGNSNKLTTDAALPTGEPRVWSPAFHETVLRKLLSVATEGAEKQNQQQQNKNNNKSKSKLFQQQRNNAKPPEPLNFSRDALRAINCSVELILKDLANECVKVARRRGLKTINYDIVADICTRVDRFSFLSDVIPTPPMGMIGGNRVVSSKKTRAAATATTTQE